MKMNEEAVSPVIGVILMVAITVILAAVIAAFVFGLAGTTSTTKNVGLTIALNTSNLAAVTVQGGTDLPQLNNLSYRLDGGSTTYGFTDSSGTAITSSTFPMRVGQMLYSSGNVSLRKVAVIGSFKDGSETVLLEKQF